VFSGFVVLLFMVFLFSLFPCFGSLLWEGSWSYAPPTYRKKNIYILVWVGLSELTIVPLK